MWNNKRSENSIGKTNYNERRVTAEKSAMMMRQEFHTWDMEDDQSVTSKVTKKDEKKEKENKMDPNQPNAKSKVLLGLPKDLTLESDSDGEDIEKEMNDFLKLKSNIPGHKEKNPKSGLPKVEGKDGGSDNEQEENVISLQQKTLQPMLSEEEIEEKERAFMTKLQQVKSFLHATVFAFAEKLRENKEPTYPPLSPDPKPSQGGNERGEKLSFALDRVLAQDVDLHSVNTAEQILESTAKIGGMQFAEDFVSPSLMPEQPPQSVPIIFNANFNLPELREKSKEEIAKEVADQLASALSKAMKDQKHPKPSYPSTYPVPVKDENLPALMTEQIKDEMNFLSLKIKRKKQRDFDWDRNSASSTQPPPRSLLKEQVEESNSPQRQAQQDVLVQTKSVLSVLDHQLSEPMEEKAVAVNYVETKQLSLAEEVTQILKPGSIGFDRRSAMPQGNAQILLLDIGGSRPITPLSSRTEASPLTPRGNKVTVGGLRSNSLGSISSSSSSTVFSLRSFALPPSAVYRMKTRENEKDHSDALSIHSVPFEDKILKLSSNSYTNLANGSAVPGAVARSLSQQNLTQKNASLQKENSLRSL